METFSNKKIIYRLDLDTDEICMFMNTGIWGNGYLAYSKLTKSKDGKLEIKDYDNGTYYQIRKNGKLVMIHV